ncbi:MAG: linear amide C-N hydrolase [Thermomicrobiales bacterium]
MCSRITYLGPDDIVMTGRSLDWTVPMQTSFYVMPAGLEQHGAAGPDSITWTSQYGSLVIVGYDGVSVDGLNEHGLLVNKLYLAEADYGAPVATGDRPLLSVAGWGQYVLDHYRNVDEVVAGLREEPFRLVALTTPDGNPAVVHMSVTDPTGDTAIFEYVGGKLNIYHSREYQVMTNSPAFNEQLALTAYWQEIGDTMLPGTGRAADRFVRGSYYLHTIPVTGDYTKAAAATLSIIRNMSVPLGVESTERPNDASTRWRIVADLKNRMYFFESAESPYMFWLDAKPLDYSVGAQVLRLGLTVDSTLIVDGEYFFGLANGLLRPEAPYAFLPAGV